MIPRTLFWLSGASLSIAAGCAGATPEPTNSPSTGAAAPTAGTAQAPPEAREVDAGPDLLLILVRPSISQPHDPTPLPEAFPRAEALFEQARRDYEEEKRYDRAAAGFLAAAKALLAPAGPYDDSFTGNRQICYRNAAAAFDAAGDAAGAAAAFTAAKGEDPASSATLDELLARFEKQP